MNGMKALIVRNLKLYFRDKTAVLMSLLASLIIILLYVLFLGKTTADSLKGDLGAIEHVEWLVGAWIMSGIIVINSFNTSLAAFASLVRDREESRLSGFLVTPISGRVLVGGYIFSAWIIGTIMTLITFFVAELYIYILGGDILTFTVMIKVFGIILLNVFASTAFAFFLVSLIKSMGAFAAMSGIIGTVIGFATGVYMPIGLMPGFIQTIMKVLPISHGTVLMRQLFMEVPIQKVFTGVDGAMKSSFLQEMGIVFYINNKLITPNLMILSVFIAGIVFTSLSILMFQRKK